MSLQIIPASPIQRLPYDILRHIFGYVCQSDPVGPMFISQVSQRWHSVALDSPLIWRYITIWLEADTTDTGSPQHLLASTYFKRSQNVPIALTIYATRHFETHEKEELIQPYSHRFRSLNIKVNEGSVASLLWMQMGTITPIPRLEVFETEISNFSRLSIIGKTIASENIIPPVSDALILWDLWEPTGLTELRLDTTLLFNKPDLDEIHHALFTTCSTLQHLEYQGLIGSLGEDELSAAGPPGRGYLEFPELRSLAVLCNDNIVPLLEFMMIPALDSLLIRDFITYPTTSTPGPDLDEMDVDDFTFDPNRLFLAIKQWTSIKNLEIYGLDLSPDDVPPLPEMLHYIGSLNQLESLVLYGIGMATSMARTLFTHQDSLLPNLSRFLLGISKITTDNSDDLSDFLVTRRRHQLPRLQRLSINMDYFQHLSNFNRVGILWEGSDDIFLFADPEVNKFIPIEEVPLKRRQ
jgi:hypothetical protein